MPSEEEWRGERATRSRCWDEMRLGRGFAWVQRSGMDFMSFTRRRWDHLTAIARASLFGHMRFTKPTRLIYNAACNWGNEATNHDQTVSILLLYSVSTFSTLYLSHLSQMLFCLKIPRS